MQAQLLVPSIVPQFDFAAYQNDIISFSVIVTSQEIAPTYVGMSLLDQSGRVIKDYPPALALGHTLFWLWQTQQQVYVGLPLDHKLLQANPNATLVMAVWQNIPTNDGIDNERRLANMTASVREVLAALNIDIVGQITEGLGQGISGVAETVGNVGQAAASASGTLKDLAPLLVVAGGILLLSEVGKK